VKLTLYIVGGVLLWLGVYGYLKTRGSVGLSPLPDTRTDLAYQLSGLLGRVAMMLYLVAMVFVFEWWYVIVFFVIGGVLTGVLYSRLAAVGAAVAIICVPLGIALAGIALAF
jgi:hypothetical protein